MDGRGTPLGVTLTGANRHDSVALAPTLDAIPPIRSGKRGRQCRERGIKPRIARRGLDSSQRLGRHRCVVERTHAWMAQLRRLTIRYEGRDDIHLASILLGCALACLNPIRRSCWAL